MNGNNSYDEKQRGCNCNEPFDQIRGILVCKKCKTARINQRDNTSAKKECEKIVRSIDALLLKKGNIYIKFCKDLLKEKEIHAAKSQLLNYVMIMFLKSNLELNFGSTPENFH